MYWRLPHGQWMRQKGQRNKNAFRRLVQSPSGPPPGLIAYLGKEPVGWCALAPREQYPRFNKSRVLAPVDDQPVWSITCFFVARSYRRQGVSLSLLREAVKFASRHGAQILEGYPWEARADYPDVFYYTGQISSFRRAGFKEVLRRSAVRPIMRHRLKR